MLYLMLPSIAIVELLKLIPPTSPLPPPRTRERIDRGELFTRLGQGRNEQLATPASACFGRLKSHGNARVHRNVSEGGKRLPASGELPETQRQPRIRMFLLELTIFGCSNIRIFRMLPILFTCTIPYLCYANNWHHVHICNTREKLIITI